MVTHTPEQHAHWLVTAALAVPFDHRRVREPGWEWSVNFPYNAFQPVVWQTREQAEWHIEMLMKLDPEGVRMGVYSIDGPNEDGNEFATRYQFSFDVSMIGRIVIEDESEQDARDKLATLFVNPVQAYAVIDEELLEFEVSLDNDEPTLVSLATRS